MKPKLKLKSSELGSFVRSLEVGAQSKAMCLTRNDAYENEYYNKVINQETSTARERKVFATGYELGWKYSTAHYPWLSGDELFGLVVRDEEVKLKGGKDEYIY